VVLSTAGGDGGKRSLIVQEHLSRVILGSSKGLVLKSREQYLVKEMGEEVGVEKMTGTKACDSDLEELKIRGLRCT
jgi:hypothetical protein